MTALSLLALAVLLVYVGMKWSVRRRKDHRDPYDAYWFGDYTPDAVTDTLAAAGAEARSGCACEGCEHLRATAADAVFRVTEDDIAELDRIGIAWEVDPA